MNDFRLDKRYEEKEYFVRKNGKIVSGFDLFKPFIELMENARREK
ncbi:MAG: hypothetical protein ACM339_02125 [Ignavibacteria bacterium]